MDPGTIVLIGLALLAIGVASIWSRSDGHGFGGSLGLVVFALPVLLLTGRL